jgi:type IX secretion system PorP/SprF family membrane protein
MKKYFLLIIWSVFVACNLQAQDGHFTQFYNIPGYANPALVGTSNASYRVSTIFRDQWFSALNKPINSFAFSGDLSFSAGGDQRLPDVIGIGIMFYNDKVSEFDFSTNQISITGSYTKLIDRAKKQFLGLGMQASMIGKSLGYGNLFFGDQFNSIDGFTNVTAEELPANNLGFFDVSLGLNYSIEPIEGQKANIGFSAFHIMSPNVSFYNQDEILRSRYDTKAALPLRWTAHGSYKFTMRKSLNTETRAVYNRQGPFEELNASQLFSFYSPLQQDQNFFIGPGVRLAKYQSNGFLGFESINATAGVQLNKVVISASFDHAIGPIINNRSRFNTFEISVSLFGDYKNEVDICPKF